MRQAVALLTSALWPEGRCRICKTPGAGALLLGDVCLGRCIQLGGMSAVARSIQQGEMSAAGKSLAAGGAASVGRSNAAEGRSLTEGTKGRHLQCLMVRHGIDWLLGWGDKFCGRCYGTDHSHAMARKVVVALCQDQLV